MRCVAGLFLTFRPLPYPQAIARYLDSMVTQRRTAFWASASNAVQGQEQKRLGALVLEQRKSVPLTDEEALPAVLKVGCVGVTFTPPHLHTPTPSLMLFLLPLLC